MEAQVQLPHGLRLMATQVAGHTFQHASTDTSTDTLGLLQDTKAGCVFKPLGKPECGERESNFYETLYKSDEGGVLAQAKLLIPKFYRKLKLVVNQHEYMFLQLEDLTRGLSKPCIMDIKIGKRTWDPLATAQKRAVEEQKYARCKQVLGLCLPGFQLYTLEDNGQRLIRHSKEYGKQLDSDGFRATIAYFLNAQHQICYPLVREVLCQLYSIRNWFHKQTFYHFYASSLLIAYDFEVLQTWLRSQQQLHITNGNTHENGLKSELPRAQDWVKVKMIDFAHVFPAESGSQDNNYLYGLQQLISIVEQLLLLQR